MQMRLLTKYQITALSRLTINVWYQSYMERGSHALRGEYGWPTIIITKQNWVKEMLKSDTPHSLRDATAILRVHHTPDWHISRRKLNIFP